MVTSDLRGQDLSRLGIYRYLIQKLLGRAFVLNARITRVRDRIFSTIAGQHPRTNPFHHQWAMNRLLLNFATSKLLYFKQSTSVLDVGVGSAPYWNLRKDLIWSGLDVETTPYSNFLIEKNKSWPIIDNSFDNVFCTQVIEHVEEPSFLVTEIWRVLRPGGLVILNAPFIYPFHGMPEDNARYTTSQLNYLFQEFEVIESGTIGGVGSSLATIFLNFVNYQLSGNAFGQIIKVFFFPFWLLLNFIANLALVSWDKFDSTGSFPTNTYIIARKVV